MLLVVGYPLAKRYTYWPQFILGEQRMGDETKNGVREFIKCSMQLKHRRVHFITLIMLFSLC